MAQRVAQRKSSASTNRRYSRRVNRPTSTSAAASLHAVDIFGDPEQRVEVAQAALALLDVGLDLVAGIAGLDDALVALGELGGDEFGGGRLHQVAVEAGRQAHGRADSSPRIGRASRMEVRMVMSARGEAQALVDRAGGMADLLAEVPEHVEDRLGDALAPGRLLGRQQEEEVDVRARRQRAAAIAADGDDRDALARRRDCGRCRPSASHRHRWPGSARPGGGQALGAERAEPVGLRTRCGCARARPGALALSSCTTAVRSAGPSPSCSIASASISASSAMRSMMRLGRGRACRACRAPDPAAFDA